MPDSSDYDMLHGGGVYDDSPASEPGPGYGGVDGGGGGGSGETDQLQNYQQQEQEQDQHQQQQQQQPTKRTRVLLSCAPCRISKLKCDRESPCGNCLKKDRVDLCEYAPRPKKPTKPAKGMAARLRRLEGMLREMMDDDSAAAAMSKFGVSSSELLGGGMEFQLPLTGAFADGDIDGRDGEGLPLPSTANKDPTGGDLQAEADEQTPSQPRGKGRVVRGQRATTYVGATHFMVMLDDIDDLKAYFEDPQDELDDDVGMETSAEYEAMENLMMGASGAPPGRLRTKSDLLRTMPPRSVTDRLITRFFNSHTPSHHVLHRPTFTKKYKAFWDDMANVDNAFLAVIFVILELGIHFSTFSAPRELELDGTNMTPVERYREFRAAASCALTLTRFTNPSTATLQAMVIFVEAEFLVNRVSQTNCFLLLGVCIRIMLKMGLHRDPSRLPNISPFEGEIRRRLWNLAIQLDLIVSFYLGLPSMIHGIPSDTSLVHNLLDEDFDEDSVELPPSRPDSEHTAMSYTIFKSMVCRVFGQVARLSHTLTPPSYAEVMRTDQMLEDKWRQIPQFMKVRPVDDCVADPPLLVVQRFGIASLYQRSRCVLHRPYLLEENPLPEHTYSRRACFQSALALLEYHRAVHEATQPGAVLHQIGWFITGLGMHDFLLAAMIVFIVVQNESKFEPELLVGESNVAHKDGKDGKDGKEASWSSPSNSHADSSGRGAATVSSTSTATTFTTVSPSNAALSTTTTSERITSSSSSSGPANYGSHASLPVERSMLIEMLRRSHEIWAEVAQKNSDAVKAADLVGVMLRKIYAHDLRDKGSPPSWSPPVDQRHSQQYSQPYSQPYRQASSQPSSQLSSQLSSQTYGHPHSQLQTQEPSPQEQDSGYTLQTADYYGEPTTAGGLMPLPETIFQNFGIESSMPVSFMGPPVGSMPPTSMAPTADAQMGFSRRDLVPPVPMPEDNATRYDAWIPPNLGDINWNTVDTGIRVSSQQTNEWTTADSVLTDINYAAASLWDHPGTL
ncbi:fungal specific transcription factor domain-containing protein [Ophiostoma piceae UAMH 11346]|uniref:Fungal specific transcription factor domain-containing protein n=1 Tax=Ophiostoma piceae (strain UAMH 11346) TaxID=1262450 RepID=S3CS13_OPHP1|nr:fungal specific transcription factor domain-containing protein [Ophiostoma piceae UAMH 11346]